MIYIKMKISKYLIITLICNLVFILLSFRLASTIKGFLLSFLFFIYGIPNYLSNLIRYHNFSLDALTSFIFSDVTWNIIFIVCSMLFVIFLFYIFTGKINKVKKICLYILFAFYSICIIRFGYLDFIGLENPNVIPFATADNHLRFIDILILIIGNLFLLIRLKIITLRGIKNIIFNYFILFLEVILTIYIGYIILIKVYSENLSPIEPFFLKLTFFIIGFFGFLILEIIRKKLNKNLDNKHPTEIGV